MKNIYYFCSFTLISFVLCGFALFDIVYADGYIDGYNSTGLINYCDNTASCNFTRNANNNGNAVFNIVENQTITSGTHLTYTYGFNVDFFYLDNTIININQPITNVIDYNNSRPVDVSSKCSVNYFDQQISVYLPGVLPGQRDTLKKTYSISYTCDYTANVNFNMLRFTLNVPSGYLDSSQVQARIYNYSFTFGKEFDFNSILQNQNQNTQNIINNQNQNSQNIINNQNQNQQQTNEHLNDINNSINNSNVDDDLMNDFLDNDNFEDFEGLQDIITLPLELVIQMGDTCQPIVLKLPYFGNIELPCPSTFYSKMFKRSQLNTIKTIINGILIYRLLIDMFYLVKNAKDPQTDKIEVVDL